MMYDVLRTDLKTAMRHKEPNRISTLRLILAAVKDKEISMRSAHSEQAQGDQAIVIGDDTVTEVLSKMRKQRVDSIAMYEEAGRLELADSEREEIGIIEKYLPQQLSEADIEALAQTRINDLNATGLRDMGRVMASLKETHAGKIDFAKAGAIIKNILMKR